MNQLNTLNGELQHIIDNVRQIGSNSTDIQSPGLHLSISVDNNKLLNKKQKIQQQNQKIQQLSRPTFGFNMGRGQTKQIEKKIVSGPKIIKLEKNENLRYILVTKKGEVIAIHKNSDENINPSLK